MVESILAEEQAGFKKKKKQDRTNLKLYNYGGKTH